MNLASLISGGKDSIFAAYMMKEKGHTIRCFLSMFPESDESYMFHFPNVDMTRLQAESAGIPIKVARTAGVKEDELLDLKNLISSVSGDVDGLTTGALASNYQKERIDSICKELGIESIAPLWHMDPG